MSWLLFACGSAFFAGLTAILAKIGIRNVNSNLATALRTVVVLLFAWLMVFVVGSQGSLSEVPLKSHVFLILSGFATGASWICYFRALQLGDVNKVVPIDKSSTILTMILAFVFFQEPISGPLLAGMCLMGIGTYMMIQRQQAAAASETKTAGGGAWLIFAALSAVFAALTAILGKVGVEHVESNLATALRTIVVLAMAWGIVFFQGTQKDIRHIDRKSMLFIILSGLATGLSWLCYYRALQIGKASLVVPIDKLSIVLTVAFSYIFLKEKLTAKSFAGLVLIVAGTLLLLV